MSLALICSLNSSAWLTEANSLALKVGSCKRHPCPVVGIRTRYVHLTMAPENSVEAIPTLGHRNMQLKEEAEQCFATDRDDKPMKKEFFVPSVSGQGTAGYIF